MITVVAVWLYDDYLNVGNLALAMTITNIFASIALYNSRNFQVSDIREEYKDGEYVMARLLTCAAAILLCAAFVFIVDFTPVQRIIIICYMLFRANESFIDVLHGIDQKNWKMEYIGISLAVRGILMLTAFVIFGWLFDILFAIIAMAVSTTIVGFLYDIPKTKKLAVLTSNAGKQIYLLIKRCFPLMILSLVNIAIITYARFALERIHGTEALGAYTAVSTPAMVIQIAATMLFVPLINLLSGCLKTGDKKRFTRLFILTAITLVMMTSMFAVLSHFFGEWTLDILYDYTIIPYAYLLPGASVAVGLISCLVFMNLIFTAIRDIKGLFVGNLIGLVISLSTANVLLNYFGIIGVNHVMIISQAVVVFLLTIRLFWYIKTNPGLFLPPEPQSE